MMQARRMEGVVTAAGALVVSPEQPLAPGDVEVIVLYREPVVAGSGPTSGDHPAFGIWADRGDTQDSAAFAAELRRSLESRADSRG